MNNVSNPGPIGPAGARGPGISVQQDMTASRAIDGTVYHNTTSGIIIATVSINLGSGTNAVVKADGSTPPTTTITQLSNSNLSTIAISFTFVVMPGAYYGITGAGASMAKWIEYR